jgi:AcrR family transcriptional regulator
VGIMQKKNNPDAKNRILQAAIQIFAKKSFEGSRIDEIAQEAKVPKSLIYYHFKSKNEILNVLMKNFIHEYTAIIRTAGASTHQDKVEELPERMKHTYKDFAFKNADLIRIMLIDSLKKSTEQPIIYRLVEALIEMEEQSLELGKQENYNRNERLIAEFFTNIIPNCAFLCFSDSWIHYFKVDKEEFEKLFLAIITTTHGAYHSSHE